MAMKMVYGIAGIKMYIFNLPNVIGEAFVAFCGTFPWPERDLRIVGL